MHLKKKLLFLVLIFKNTPNGRIKSERIYCVRPEIKIAHARRLNAAPSPPMHTRARARASK